MNRKIFSKRLFVCLLMIMILSAMGAFAAQAAVTLEKPKKVKITATEKTATLTWRAVNKATGYVIYMKDESSAKYKKVGRVKGENNTTYTQKKLKAGKTYSFYVVAFRKKNNKLYYSDRSKQVQHTQELATPEQLKNLLAMSQKDTAVLIWAKSKSANKYIVQMKEDGSWKTLQTTKKLTATISDLKTGNTYKFRVRPVREKKGLRKVGKGVAVTIKIETLQTQAERLVTRDVYDVQMTRTVTARKLDGSGTVTLPAGMALGAVWKGYNYGDATNDHIVEYFVMRDGTKVEGVQDACTPLGDLNWNHTKAYSNLVAEYYVNTIRPQTSKTNWCLWVNYYTQYIYAFNRKDKDSKWKWYATWETSTGKYGMTQTPRGELEIVKKSERFYFPGGGGAFGLWASHLTGEGNAIHGPRRSPNGVYMDPGEIGYPLSAGCCRLFDPYAKFVYENMAIGTRVLVA